MKKIIILFVGLLSMALLLSECKTSKPASAPAPATTAAPKEEKVPAAASPEAADISAGQLIFTTKCDRCHKQPSPTKHDDAGWKITLQKMSIKAHLTDNETAQVLKYLATANK